MVRWGGRCRWLPSIINDEEKALAARERLDQMGCQIKLLSLADVTDDKEVNQMVHAIEQSMGLVDGGINATRDQPHHPIEEYSWSSTNPCSTFSSRALF